MNELPTSLLTNIQSLCSAGDLLSSQGMHREAIAKYNEAWQEIPTPKNEWEASTWVLTAIGDASFLGNFYISGAEALRYALVCPGGFGNPFVHLRLGQCELELGNEEAAIDNLLRAYALAGKEIYGTEDSKYFQYLQGKVKPPATGVW